MISIQGALPFSRHSEDNPLDKSRYLLKEATVSALINAIISTAFFFGFFSGIDPIPIWGKGGYALDFLPQSFAVALMSALVPGLLARKAIAAGRFGAMGAPRLSRVFMRSVAWAIAGLVAGAGLATIVLLLTGVNTVSALSGLALKIVYGALLGALVTHRSVAALLSRHDGA